MNSFNERQNQMEEEEDNNSSYYGQSQSGASSPYNRSEYNEDGDNYQCEWYTDEAIENWHLDMEELATSQIFPNQLDFLIHNRVLVNAALGTGVQGRGLENLA